MAFFNIGASFFHNAICMGKTYFRASCYCLQHAKRTLQFACCLKTIVQLSRLIQPVETLNAFDSGLLIVGTHLD
jgi:hypothetical protein